MLLGRLGLPDAPQDLRVAANLLVEKRDRPAARHPVAQSRIDRLERRGIVRRVPDPHDRRGVLVELTDDGCKVLEEAVAANTASERALMQNLSARQLADLQKLLRQVLADLEPGLTGEP